MKYIHVHVPVCCSEGHCNQSATFVPSAERERGTIIIDSNTLIKRTIDFCLLSHDKRWTTPIQS